MHGQLFALDQKPCVKPGDGTMVVQDWNASATNLIEFVGTNLHTLADVQAAETYLPASNTTIISTNTGEAVWVVGVAPAALTASHFVFA